MLQYSELIKVVEELEKASTRAELTKIDISSLEDEGESAQQQRPVFSKLLESAIRIESESDAMHMPHHHAKSEEAQHRQESHAARQVQQVQVSQSSSSSSGWFAPQSYPQPTAAPAPQGPEPANQQAEKEIREFSERLGTAKREPSESAATANTTKGDLVLPQLSIPDQITELQRIIEGLNEHVFDDYHIGIVRKELLGLQRYVKSGGTESAIALPILQLRDKYLKEAIELIGAG